MVRKLEFLLLLLVLTTVSCLEDNSEKDGNETVVATDEGSHSTSKLEKTDEPAASTDFAVEKQVNDFLTNIVNQFEPGKVIRRNVRSPSLIIMNITTLTVLPISIRLHIISKLI